MPKSTPPDDDLDALRGRLVAAVARSTAGWEPSRVEIEQLCTDVLGFVEAVERVDPVSGVELRRTAHRFVASSLIVEALAALAAAEQ